MVEAHQVDHNPLFSNLEDISKEFKERFNDPVDLEFPSPTSQLQQQASHSRLLKLVVIYIRNHWAFVAPTVVIRFLCSNYPQVIESLFNVHMSTVLKLHRITNYVLTISAALSVAQKFYIKSEGLRRPPIPSPIARFFVRNHWIIFPIVLGTTYMWTTRRERAGVYSVAGIRAKTDLFLLLLAAILVGSKMHIFHKVESLDSQVKPKIDGCIERGD
jgi:hypothetical protein